MSVKFSGKVVKAVRYVKGSAGGGQASRRSLRYAAHREVEQGEGSAFREIYDAEGRKSKEEILDELDSFAKGAKERGRETYHYHVVLNPGEGRNEVDKEEWAREVMSKFEQEHANNRGGRMTWAAVTHADHADHDHVHVVMVTDKTLDKATLRAMQNAHAPECWERLKKESEQEKATREQGHSRNLLGDQERSAARHRPQGRDDDAGRSL